MENTVPSSTSVTELSPQVHSRPVEAVSQFPTTYLKNASTARNISRYVPVGGELGVPLHKGQVSTVLTHCSGAAPVIREVSSQNVESSPGGLQTHCVMETYPSNDCVGTTEAKSSYEIAAEALCLMKSGGIKSFKEKQKALEIDSAQAQASVLDSEITHTHPSYFSTDESLVHNVSASSYVTAQNVISTDLGNIQTAVTLSNGHVQEESNNLLKIENETQQNVSSGLKTSTLSSECSSETLPVILDPSLTPESSGEPIKYVLVPKSALLSSVKPGELVSVPGTPYYFMMPKETTKATETPTVPRLETFTQGKRPLYPKSSASTDTGYNHDNSPVNLSMEVNTSSYSEELQYTDLSHLTATSETKTACIKRSVKKHDSLKFPPCIICEGEASGFHYGCNTCEACKNFFRRCLLRKSNTPFICHSGKNCEISYRKNKNNCSACRLDKCLELGMAKDKCKMGRYTALMRTETIKKVRRLEGKDDENLYNSNEDSPGPSLCLEPESGLQVEVAQQVEVATTAGSDIRELYNEMISRQIYSKSNDMPEEEASNEYNGNLVEYLVNAMDDIKPWGESLVTEESRKMVIREHYEKYRSKVETFGQLNAVPMQEYQVLLRKFGIDIDGQWESFKQCSFDWEAVVGRYCCFAKRVPEFCSLSFEDQASLLKATHFDFFTIVLHQGYIREYGVFLEINGLPLHIEEAANKFFSRELVLAMTDTMARLQKMSLSKAEMALLISIVTMSSDQCNLENPSLVEKTQLRLVDLLLNETNRIYGPVTGRKRFTSVINILTKMREVSNIYHKEYRALCKDDLIRESVPNLDIVLPDEN